MNYCLFVCNLVNIHLSISIFIDSTQLKIQFLRHAASMNKTLIAGLVNVLQVIL